MLFQHHTFRGSVFIKGSFLNLFVQTASFYQVFICGQQGRERWRESAERRAPRHQHDKVHLEKRGEIEKNMRAHAQCQTFKRGAALCGDLIGEIKTIAADGDQGCECSLFYVEFPPF